MKAIAFCSLVLILQNSIFSQEYRKIELEAIINASPEEVWNCWITEEGIKSFFAPKCDIEFKIGGKYECYFTLTNPVGQQGSEDCKILSYLPYKMLSFSWGGRAKIHPTVRKEKTWVVIEFGKMDNNKTKLRFTNLGYKKGEEWDDAYDYFQNAWSGVLKQLEQKYQNK